MIFLFRKTKLFVCFSIPLWILTVVFARFFVFKTFNSTLQGILLPAMFAFVGAYILWNFAIFQANRMHRAYTDILSVECDVDRYLELYAPIREEGKKHPRTVFLTESSYATALNLAGRPEEARQIMKEIMASPDFLRKTMLDRAEAYVDLGIYSLACGDVPATREALLCANDVMEKMAIGTGEYNRVYKEIERLRHRANVAEGLYDSALEYFTDTSREYTVPFTKVNRMNTLAQIYRATGDTERLHKCLSYIAEHGGTMKMAKDAREELKKENP